MQVHPAAEYRSQIGSDVSRKESGPGSTAKVSTTLMETNTVVCTAIGSVTGIEVEKAMMKAMRRRKVNAMVVVRLRALVMVTATATVVVMAMTMTMVTVTVMTMATEWVSVIRTVLGGRLVGRWCSDPAWNGKLMRVDIHAVDRALSMCAGCDQAQKHCAAALPRHQLTGWKRR